VLTAFECRLALHRACPLLLAPLGSAEAYTLNPPAFYKVVASLNAPDIESVVRKAATESFFPLTSQLWPTRRWYHSLPPFDSNTCV